MIINPIKPKHIFGFYYFSLLQLLTKIKTSNVTSLCLMSFKEKREGGAKTVEFIYHVGVR